MYIAAIALPPVAVGAWHYFNGGHYPWQASAVTALAFPGLFLLACFLSPGHHADGGWGAGVDWRSVPALIMLLCGVFVFAAVLLPVSARLDAGGVLVIAAGLFFFGLFSNHVINNLLSPGWVYYTAKAAVPNWQVFWVPDWLATREPLDWGRLWRHTGACAVHALAYAAACLAAGGFLFNRVEVSGDDTF